MTICLLYTSSVKLWIMVPPILKLHGIMPGAVGAQVQLAEFRRDGLGDDGFPVDVVHAERLGHGAEEHDVHAFGIAELLGDLARCV